MKNEEQLYPPTIMIKNADLNTSWALGVYVTNNYGKVIQSAPNYTKDPNYVPPLTKDVCATFEYTNKALKDIKSRTIHPLYPHHDGYDEYERQFIPGTEEYEHGRTFHYTYGLRLREYPNCDQYNNSLCDGLVGDYHCEYYNRNNFTAGSCFIDQLKFISEHLDAFNKRMQAITWIPEIDLESTIIDEMEQSVPCLQRIQLRNLGNGYYEIWLNWRSRDLGKAYLWNILGLINTIDDLVQESRSRLGQEQLSLIKVTDHISSLHLYEPDWDVAAKVPININDFDRCVFM